MLGATVSVACSVSVQRDHAMEVDPQHGPITEELSQQRQTYLAGLGGVSWIVGGDWNVKPHQRGDWWGRSEMHLLDIKAPTHKQ